MEPEIVKTFRFEAAHRLPNAPENHKCRQMHGHSYRVDIHVTGEADPETGWVIDFGQIKQAVEPLVNTLDHRFLDDIEGLANSTSEMLAKYFWDKIKVNLPGLSAITVWESDTSRCIYRGK